ncbi:MAG TPA: hypothetical protein PLX06_15290 [Fimbriimonadaceae bacterium]|nr:hypothetical protein [Fimbriimonadaceae bacterium]
MDRRTYLGTVANKPLADLAIERLREEGFEVLAGQPLLPYPDAVQPYEIHMLDPDWEDTPETRAKIAEILGFGEDSELTDTEASAIEEMPSEERAEVTPRRARWGCLAMGTAFVAILLLWIMVFGSPSYPSYEFLKQAKRFPMTKETHDYLRDNGFFGHSFVLDSDLESTRSAVQAELSKKGFFEEGGQGYFSFWTERPGNRGFVLVELVSITVGPDIEESTGEQVPDRLRSWIVWGYRPSLPQQLRNLLPW